MTDDGFRLADDEGNLRSEEDIRANPSGKSLDMSDLPTKNSIQDCLDKLELMLADGMQRRDWLESIDHGVCLLLDHEADQMPREDSEPLAIARLVAMRYQKLNTEHIENIRKLQREHLDMTEVEHQEKIAKSDPVGSVMDLLRQGYEVHEIPQTLDIPSTGHYL